MSRAAQKWTTRIECHFLQNPSIINGSQTQGELRRYFTRRPEQKDFEPSIKYEIIVIDDDDRVAGGTPTATRHHRARAREMFSIEISVGCAHAKLAVAAAGGLRPRGETTPTDEHRGEGHDARCSDKTNMR